MIRLIVPIVAMVCPTPLYAQLQNVAQEHKEAPFGHRPSAGDEPDRQPVLIDIEIEKDGEFFWKGRVNGRSDKVELTSSFSENSVCVILVSASSGSSPVQSLPNNGPKLKIDIRSYVSDTIDPVRFDLSFKYERQVLAGDPCDGDFDLRTTEMRADFEIAPGETRFLPLYSGYRIMLVRQ